ncbi:hypothetical protein U7230_03710 [Carboxydochorda subterranea]|uniref:Collagen-like protein n=1 Tax=Carboxydichorda subterranea TaxID=3109565 RepID=A0ABZ1BZC7_9FIRM|nr:hypothetical protein [Limnochorda sp. L945t]WRP18122.1 hypothetical protein U7230_03710 [Limnochorda sp. L945t]
MAPMGVYSSRCEECIDSQVLPTLERRGVAGPPGPPGPSGPPGPPADVFDPATLSRVEGRAFAATSGPLPGNPNQVAQIVLVNPPGSPVVLQLVEWSLLASTQFFGGEGRLRLLTGVDPSGVPSIPVVSTNTAVPRASQTSAHAGVVDALATGTKLLDTDVLGGILYQPQVPSVWVVAPGTNLAFTYETDGTFVAYFVAIWVEVPV